ncbi:MAG: DUF2752 domain-containing protein [Lachnospiraceae bacterium]|nr:DUF2752 domain-containing protein [Lachnospiraceae bacterium]MDE6185035.1 DUF2752 domain-containing protein [Lachnospiraceae bacterium]MDE7286677.1 DUF2752 domain-containing protein [Lachnospiraceae bacterium]
MKKIRKIINRIYADLKGFRWAFLAVFVYYLVMHAIFDAFCPALVLTGMPCAGCGLTRASLFLAAGQVRRALSINPSILPVLIFALYCGYFRYVKGSKIKGLGVALGIVTACMLAIYGYRMYLYFPDRAPYTYMENNIAARWIPGYREWVAAILKSR